MLLSALSRLTAQARATAFALAMRACRRRTMLVGPLDEDNHLPVPSGMGDARVLSHLFLSGGSQLRQNVRHSVLGAGVNSSEGVQISFIRPGSLAERCDYASQM